MQTVKVAVACLAVATACPLFGQSTVTSSAADPETLKMQVLLDRLGFSPGVIDGHKGASFTKALKGFQTARDVPVSGELDAKTIELLQPYASLPPVIDVTLDDLDFAGPFVGAIPKSPAAQAKLPAMGYSDPLEGIAERYHTTKETLIALNSPETKVEKGAHIKVPNVRPEHQDFAADLRPDWRATLTHLSVSSDEPQAEKVVVSKSEGVLRVYANGGALVAQFPATMGSSHDPLPIGTWKILGRSYLPKYHYNPARFWDANKKDDKQTLPAGPNGPTGVVWIDINKPHYGIHGTPSPDTIGRAESHGCVRLTNWDAARLATMVKYGTPAVFEK